MILIWSRLDRGEARSSSGWDAVRRGRPRRPGETRMKPIQLGLAELMLAIPFAGLFTATVLAGLTGGIGSYYLNALVSELVLFPLVYMVLLLMVRQHRGR